MPGRFVFRVNCEIKGYNRVVADNYQQAATIVARKLYGRALSAVRRYGDDNFSGYFQACTVRSKGEQPLFVGKPFHLQMLANTDSARHTKEAYKMFAGLHYIRNADLKHVS